jgi:hypothetical protein
MLLLIESKRHIRFALSFIRNYPSGLADCVNKELFIFIITLCVLSRKVFLRTSMINVQNRVDKYVHSSYANMNEYRLDLVSSNLQTIWRWYWKLEKWLGLRRIAEEDSRNGTLISHVYVNSPKRYYIIFRWIKFSNGTKHKCQTRKLNSTFNFHGWHYW